MSGIGKGHGEKFSRLADQFASALLRHSSIGKAAASVGIDESTGRRWMKDPEFIAIYRLARRTALEESSSRMQAGAAVAVETLLHVAKHGKRDFDRVSAAKAIWDGALQAGELNDLTERLEALEAAQ